MKVAFRECWQGFLLCIAIGMGSAGGFYALPQWSTVWTIFLWISGLGVLVLLFFFRDPDRPSLFNERLILAPADGTVVSIEDGVHHEFITGPAKRVSIFLSVYNVHVQRSPIDGLIERLEHRRGRFHPAWSNLASRENEQNMIGIRRSDLSVLLCQVAGVLARRTVSWVGVGDHVRAGERIGLIKFGSRVDLYVPENVEFVIRKGEKVKAGVTVLGTVSVDGGHAPPSSNDGS